MDLYYPEKILEPQVTKRSFDGIEKECFLVEISEIEFDLCLFYSKKRWSNKKTGEWGRGLINTEEDPAKVERIGLFGEFAFAKIFGLPVDLSYKEGGDKQDFLLFNKYSINIKTSQRNYGLALVKARTRKNGIRIPIKHDIFVFAYIDEDDMEQKKTTVVLVGFELGEIISQLPEVPALRGRQLNYGIPPEKGIPFKNLKSILDLYKIYLTGLKPRG